MPRIVKQKSAAPGAEPVMDYNKSLGGAALGGRLRRLSERVDRDANRVYAAFGVDFEQRWLGVLDQLVVFGPMSVNELAKALAISHPSVSQTRNSLRKAGLIVERADPADGRRRTLHLTAKGKALVAKLQPAWAVLDQVGIAINAEAGDVVAALNRLEDVLDRKSIFDRVNDGLARKR